MNIVTDGERSKKWIGFAKNKLNTLSGMFGDVNKMLDVDGYKIQLYAMDDVRKVKISAPPALVAYHVEYPPAATVGSIILHYSEPYGANAYRAGAAGGLDVQLTLDEYTVAKSSSLVGGQYYSDAPGLGVVFPSTGDLYMLGLGFYLQYTDGVYGLALLDSKFANAASIEIGTTEQGLSTFQAASAGWQVSVPPHVFACYFRTNDTNSNRISVYGHGFNYRDDVVLDLDSPEIQSAIGTDRHLSIISAFIYPVGSKARLAAFARPTDSAVNPELLGAYFFDFTLAPPDGDIPAALSWTYVGRSQTSGLGPVWTTNSSMQFFGGPAMSLPQQGFKSAIFSDGDGGVFNIIHHPSIAAADGLFQLSPGSAAQRLSAPVFPPGVVSDPNTWATVFRSTTSNLALVEKIYDSGPETTPITEIVSIHSGGPSSWTALPMPSGTLLAVRPVAHDAYRTAFIGVVFDGSDSYFTQYDSSRSSQWILMGKVTSGRMLRPIVGMFGNHEFSSLSWRFPGSFPVTDWAGTRSYTG